MGLFQALVRTTINAVTLPVDLLKDIGEVAGGDAPYYIKKKLKQLKEEANTD